jgi:AraC-like DNA-binding protein
VPAAAELSPGNAGWSFFHVCGGHGYLLEPGRCQELAAGDLVVLPPTGKAALRSSQLAALRLCHFSVRPEQLAGFFTLRELEALRTGAADHGETGRVFPGADAVARQYGVICDLRLRERGAVVRCEMLRLAILALRQQFAAAAGPVRLPPPPPETRLAALLAKLPEAEFLRLSTDELASACACSERHLRRMFQQSLGVSLLQRRIQLRIERAKHLLRETDAKVIEVAFECGFRSLGPFNATFKRLTGKTPTAWRQATRALDLRQDRRQPPLCPRAAARSGTPPAAPQPGFAPFVPRIPPTAFSVLQSGTEGNNTKL